jgi:DNA-directed RNA polymerase specialized sigma24 family protein
MRHLADQPRPAGAADAAALAELFRQHHGELVRLATMIVRSRETAEDVVQDVFAGIQSRSARQAHPETPLPYLRAAVLNRCRSVLWRSGSACCVTSTMGWLSSPQRPM